MAKKIDDISGYEFEELMFGLSSRGQDVFEYQAFDQAYSLVRARQEEWYGWDPVNPATFESYCLRGMIEEKLKDTEPKVELRMYCAIGSCLDQYHSTDGVFEIGLGRYVSFDLTTNPCPEALEEKRRHENEFYPRIVIEYRRLITEGGYEYYSTVIAQKLAYMTSRAFELGLLLRRQEELDRRIKARKLAESQLTQETT